MANGGYSETVGFSRMQRPEIVLGRNGFRRWAVGPEARPPASVFDFFRGIVDKDGVKMRPALFLDFVRGMIDANGIRLPLANIAHETRHRTVPTQQIFVPGVRGSETQPTVAIMYDCKSSTSSGAQAIETMSVAVVPSETGPLHEVVHVSYRPAYEGMVGFRDDLLVRHGGPDAPTQRFRLLDTPDDECFEYSPQEIAKWPLFEKIVAEVIELTS